MVAVRHLEFSKFAIVVTCLCIRAILLPSSTFELVGQYDTDTYSQKLFSIWRSAVVLKLIISIFHHKLEARYASAQQISSNSDDSRLSYGESHFQDVGRPPY